MNTDALDFTTFNQKKQTNIPAINHRHIATLSTMANSNRNVNKIQEVLPRVK